MPSLKEKLNGILSQEELTHLRTSYDMLGDIAIVEIPPELESKEKEIAKAVVSTNRRIKVVAKKVGPVSGKYRVRPLKIILCLREGDNNANNDTHSKPCNTETILRENGFRIKLDVSKVFYSIRLGTERERIAEQVKDGENVLVMFAGVGPFALAIAKKKVANIVAVEWNADAVKYMEESIKLNRKLKGSIIPVLGDVQDVVPKRYTNWANRIVMPLPNTADSFIDIAVIASKNNALIHTYTFMDPKTWQNDLDSWLKERCEEVCKKYNVKLKLVSAHIVRPYAPHIVQIGIIFRVLKE